MPTRIEGCLNLSQSNRDPNLIQVLRHPQRLSQSLHPIPLDVSWVPYNKSPVSSNNEKQKNMSHPEINLSRVSFFINKNGRWDRWVFLLNQR